MFRVDLHGWPILKAKLKVNSTFFFFFYFRISLKPITFRLLENVVYFGFDANFLHALSIGLDLGYTSREHLSDELI